MIKTCGKGEIRTLGTVARTTVFETVPFDRSGTFPDGGCKLIDSCILAKVLWKAECQRPAAYKMNPEGLQKEGQLLPNSRTYLCPRGSHMSMYDDQQNYFNYLIPFIKEVDNGSFIADKK